jgi:hypothetical protein
MGSPTIGSSDGNMWYGNGPGSFVIDNSYAMNTGAQTNYLAVQFNTVVPEPTTIYSLILMLAAIAGWSALVKPKRAGQN